MQAKLLRHLLLQGDKRPGGGGLQGARWLPCHSQPVAVHERPGPLGPTPPVQVSLGHFTFTGHYSAPTALYCNTN